MDNIDDLFKLLNKRTQDHQDKIDNNIPEVANWWYYKGRFFGDRDFNDEGIEHNEWIEAHQSHDKHWRKVVIQFPELKDLDYTAIPHGKVLFHKTEQRSYVLISKDLINDTKIKTDILKEYNLAEDTGFDIR